MDKSVFKLDERQKRNLLKMKKDQRTGGRRKMALTRLHDNEWDDLCLSAEVEGFMSVSRYIFNALLERAREKGYGFGNLIQE
jgi:hypothetical protein